MTTILPADCTMAHVFQNIRTLELQAAEELGNGIDYGQLPPPFNHRKAEHEVKYDYERDTKDEYLPVIQRALGIRHFLIGDSEEDAAIAESNSLKWYFVAIRPQPDLFTIIKYRSPSPCPDIVLKLAGLEGPYNRHRYAEDFDVFVPCGTAETADVPGKEPQSSALVARRLWVLAPMNGGSKILMTPTEGGRRYCEGQDAQEWMRFADQDSLDALWSEFIPTADELEEEQARAVALMSAEASRQGAKRRRGGGGDKGAPSANYAY